MQIQTFSIIVGSAACNARCPFCVSKMTPNEISNKLPQVNWRNFEIACRLAEKAGCTTAMLTGKGEPTLWPDLIEEYLFHAKKYFPLIELQTNGLTIADGKISNQHLDAWYNLGLTTIAISVAHWEAEQNAKIYRESGHFDLGAIIRKLQKIGFSVRISFVLTSFFENTPFAFALDALNEFRKLGPDQITIMPVNRPKKSSVLPVINTPEEWVDKHSCSSTDIYELYNYLCREGDLLLELAHGASVFDFKGQNVCLSNCLKDETIKDNSTMRNLIFHPDGHLRWDWSHQGSVIL